MSNEPKLQKKLIFSKSNKNNYLIILKKTIINPKWQLKYSGCFFLLVFFYIKFAINVLFLILIKNALN